MTATAPEQTARQATSYYGKYRGVVASNIDPLGAGRLQVAVSDILGDDSCLWALPAVPVAGPDMGTYAVPPVNANVWVEFEGGDSDYPVWVGCWVDSPDDLPAQSRLTMPPVETMALATTGGTAVAVSDLPGPAGGLVLRSAGGTSVIVNDTGIYLDNGRGASIVLASNTVDASQGALTVT
jgi:uncharacterized protein involved in type VI secretion and phage assembly